MNPIKCAFGVSAGKFLGFIIHEKGIEIDPKRIETMRKVEAPTCKKNLQKFLGKVNYLRRFISNLSGKIDEALGEGYRALPKKNDKCDPKPVWVHAWKVNHGGDFLNTTIDGEI